MELPTDVLMEILHRLPSKSLARFKCVSRSWERFIFGSSDTSCRSRRWKPSTHMIGFYYQTICEQPPTQFLLTPEEESLETDRGKFDKSVDFHPSGSVYIIASSKGFLLCCKQEIYQRNYYVYNPATRQYLALPVTQMCIRNVAIGFHCKVDDPNKDLISFTIVRYNIPAWNQRPQSSVTIESISSQTNTWTESIIELCEPLSLYNSSNSMWLTAAGAIDGVFYWLNGEIQISIYDSVGLWFGSLRLPDEIIWTDTKFLGVSGEILCFASYCYSSCQLTVWHLKGNTWERKYVNLDIINDIKTCPSTFGLVLSRVISSVEFHPAEPHILYLDLYGKFICYDMDNSSAELVFDFGCRKHVNFFPYEWHEWPRLLLA